jgi:hypothetical protein
MDYTEEKATEKMCLILSLIAAINKPNPDDPQAVGCAVGHCMFWEPIQVISGNDIIARPKGRCRFLK